MVTQTLHTLKATYRFIIFWLLRWTPLVTYGGYTYPEEIGYRGWWDFCGMCIVFHRDDGSLQYRW